MNDIKSLRLIFWSTEGICRWFPFSFKAEPLFPMAWAKGSSCSPESGFSRAEHPHTVGSLPALKQHRLFISRSSLIFWMNTRFLFLLQHTESDIKLSLQFKDKIQLSLIAPCSPETALFCRKSSCRLCSLVSFYNLIKCYKIMRITEISFYKN